MLYVRITHSLNGVPAQAVVEQPTDSNRAELCNRNDWKTMLDAELIAAALNDTVKENRYLATDAGPHVSPRYDVIELPRVGDKVSYAFNGDSYPCGEIVSISKSLKVIVTSEGKKFYRRRQTGSWINNGTWSLVPGHISKWNPEF